MRTVFLALLCVIAASSYGQSLTPFVTSTAGDFFVNNQANASLSFTVGEMTMVETFFNQGVFLTQGFQQADPPSGTAIEIEHEDLIYLFEFWPNPADDYLNVRYQLKYPGTVELRMVNMNGVEVTEAYVDRYTGGFHEDRLDLTRLSQGMYFLQVRYLVPRRGVDLVSFHKINVINN